MHFYNYIIVRLYMYIICISCCNVSLWVSVCLSVITGQKIDQVGGPEIFFNRLVWPNITYIYIYIYRQKVCHACMQLRA